MNKQDKDKYEFVFWEAEKFLIEKIQNNKLNPEDVFRKFKVFKKFLDGKSEFKNRTDANLRLIKSLANRERMAKVIGIFDKNKEKIEQIVFNGDPEQILDKYKNADDLLEIFKDEFKPINHGPKSQWYQFSKGIISGSKFMMSFKGKADFDEFIRTFDHNKYTKASLPMLLKEEIFGSGFPLACVF